MSDEFDAVLSAVGPRLRALRRRRGATLTALSETTGIPVSTLSRLESGHRKPGGLQAFKQILPAGPTDAEPDPRSHEGYHWLYALNGRLRLVLGDQDLVLTAGEVAEFDTHLPHWFGNADTRPVEYLSILGPQGERFHIRARHRRA
ncbi:helix-turn-helix transcriptional regulator [Saccharopolyspora erythraea]|uniref:XRE family transcriptional regulator n=1 Tax=Saccharopolyspora erythraea TaxID=1836 RepID=UPI001BAC5835|nr:XRE family transcriptional regulator [Saccharopolyspora erythraea]QUH05621.1 helix-turn-helix transcriptional regulator [Saccharopolyspora erythraea]